MVKIKRIIAKIKKPDPAVGEQAQRRLDNLTKPQGSLGRLEELAKKICVITGNLTPAIKEKVIFTLAADHGVTAEGVSAFPAEVTAQMVYNFLRGGAGINVLARHAGTRVIIVDMGVKEQLKVKSEKLKVKKIGLGTKNFAKGPAMTKDEAIRSIEAGIELVEKELNRGIDIAGIGEMGIGNTTSAGAIASVITGKNTATVTGRGTGISDKTFKKKIEVIKQAVTLNRPDKNDGIDVLAKIGGFEIGGMAGIILACAAHRIPVVIDGFISSSAALIAHKIAPKTIDYMIAGHVSVEPGHAIILDYLGLKPLLNLDMRLGEGTGAALGINLAEAGIKILTQMATFESAGVTNQR